MAANLTSHAWSVMLEKSVPFAALPGEYSRRCSMMLSMVGLKRAFMASGLILSIPWDDHFTKSTLWGVAQRGTAVSGQTTPTGQTWPWQHSCQLQAAGQGGGG